MTTTTKTADYMGRALITPDTDARDYLNLPTIAGDRDYMGRSLTDAEGGGGDALALLDEAAVRFDFSQYTDIDDMVDVNGGWGPLDTSDFTDVATAEFIADGLRLVWNGVHNMNTGLMINGVAGPFTFGPDGFSVLFVILVPDEREIGVSVPFSVNMAADSANNFAPSLLLQWPLSADPDNPDPWFSHDLYSYKIQQGDPDFSFVVDQNEAQGPITPLTAIGAFVMCAVCDVAADETRLRLVSSTAAFDDDFPFLVSPPSFAASPMQVDYVHMGGAIHVDELTYVELLAWNRALTPAEVDALVAHFTA